jgi:hypothetical protein
MRNEFLWNKIVTVGGAHQYRARLADAVPLTVYTLDGAVASAHAAHGRDQS